MISLIIMLMVLEYVTGVVYYAALNKNFFIVYIAICNEF